MKKLFLLSLLSIFCLNLNAQRILQHTGKTITPGNKIYSKPVNRADASEWYNYGADLYTTVNNSKAFAFHLFPDSTVKVQYADGVYAVSTHSIGEVFDPCDPKFSTSREITPFMSYTLDSIVIPYSYSRPQNGAPDTLLFQVYNSSQIETVDMPGAGNTYATVGYDTLKRCGMNPIITKAVLLTNADVTGGGVIGIAANLSVAAGKKVAATVTYFPGNPFSPGDTLDVDLNPKKKINDFQSSNFLIPIAGNTHYFNNQLIIDPPIRYSYDANGWNEFYFPGTAFGPGGSYPNGLAYYYDMNFKITYDEALLGVEKEEAGIGTLVFPNPSNGILTIVHPQQELVINITDVTGRVLMSQASSNKLKDELNISSLSNGTYLCEIKSADKILAVKKVVLVK